MVQTTIDLLKAAFSLPLFLFLPGYVTRMVLRARPSAEIQEDWLEFGFQCLLFSILLTGWTGVLLAQMGRFSLFLVLLSNASYALVVGALVWYRNRSLRISPRSLDRSVWLLLGLVVLAIAIFFHPHEFIFGGADAGVYVNLGANIAHTGSWLIHAPQVASLDHALYPALFRQQPPSVITRYIQFPGFYLADDHPGLIIPQFYPLHPVWLAIFYSLGGLWASLFATPLWGLLGSLAVYFTTRTLFGHRTALLAALLLTVTATQIWFSRYPTSEMLAQFLLFGGIYAFSLYITHESLWLGILAGLALGQVTLVRIDMYFLLAVPVLYAIYLWLNLRLGKRHLAFFLPFLTQVAYSVFFALRQSWPYFYNTYYFGVQTLPLPWPLLVTFAVAGLIALFIFGRWSRTHPDWSQQLAPYGHWTTTALALLVVMAALYGYFLRPRLADTMASAYYWYGDYNIPNVEPYNLVRLGWYISPLGIALAVLGTWWMLRHETNPRTALFLGVGLFFSFLYLDRSRNNPHHIYVMRRYVPAVIPAFMIAAAYALTAWLRHNGWRRRLATGLAILLVGWLLYASRVVIPHIEYQGAVGQFERLVNALGGEQTVILFNDDLPVSTGAIVGTPLRYLRGYTVFDLQEKHVDIRALSRQIRLWQGEGRWVLLINGPSWKKDLFATARLTPVTSFLLDVPVLETSYEHFPRQIWRYKVTLQVYEFAPLPEKGSFRQSQEHEASRVRERD